jgi:hypothetical protein
MGQPRKLRDGQFAVTKFMLTPKYHAHFGDKAYLPKQ